MFLISMVPMSRGSLIDSDLVSSKVQKGMRMIEWPPGLLFLSTGQKINAHKVEKEVESPPLSISQWSMPKEKTNKWGSKQLAFVCLSSPIQTKIQELGKADTGNQQSDLLTYTGWLTLIQVGG